ncbi:hypothetical protein [Dyella telluris]|uniref:Uncharacterized protein n=1 Tax=Dyella telluris TaxID=2763498 RepID=A0A7G8Q4H6_9GAMM|nr:hypothetical protein [Dyella telluris]QNK01684.1 hypothetical protein H8F01_00445 [Dyella telluris]
MPRKAKGNKKDQAPPKPVSIITLRSSSRGYHTEALLWASQEDMIRALSVYSATPANVGAAFVGFSRKEKKAKWGKLPSSALLGEFHFYVGGWDIEIVSHEVTHSAIHRMRVLDPDGEDVLDDGVAADGEPLEEVIAYESGFWTSDIHRWLSTTDPTERPVDHGR